ncbi:MAG: DUF4838 domain-containing protein [Clostridia bacterium]|nr:DUF4838 domain-containing protein [Clostridia bacterium]
MNKKLIIFIACVCLLVMTVSVFAGCNPDNNGGNTDGLPTATNTIKDYKEHKVEGTLHSGLDNLATTGLPFVEDGKTDYKLVYDATNEQITKAAMFIDSNIIAATGASVYKENNPVWSNDAKYIIMGDSAMETAAGFVPTTEDIGITGYQIKTVGNSVFIYAKGHQGFHLGALAFLRIVIGYECLSADTIVYEKDGSYIPQMNVVERPDFDYRNNMTTYTHSLESAYPMGMSVNGSLMMDTGPSTAHNSFWYLDPRNYEFEHENCGLGYTDEECAQGHSNWYSAQRCNFTSTDGSWGVEFFGTYASQLCYTAHGNAKDKSVMQQVVADKIVELALHNPNNANKNIITFTQQDESVYCDCQHCKAIVQEYGNISAAIIMFTNGVDDIVQQKLQEYADATGTEKKEVNILIFAYQETRFAPTKLDEDSKCNPNVGVYLASSKTRYSHTFYDSINELDKKAIEDWGKFGKLYYWFYNLNSDVYFIPSNVFETIAENYRFARENNGIYLGDNGVWITTQNTGFTYFKEYLISRYSFNVNYDYNQLKSQFFKYYYGDGGVYMEQFFDELIAYMSYQRDFGGNIDFNGVCVNCYNDQAKYWPYQMVVRWNELCNQALRAIEHTKLQNDGTYERLRNHIVLESMFPRYALCMWYEKQYTAEQVAEMRLAFYNDCNALGLSREDDYRTLDALWQSWGLS